MPTKKDFIAVAAILKGAPGAVASPTPEALAMRDRVARELADLYARQNANFDRARFLAACGVA